VRNGKILFALHQSEDLALHPACCQHPMHSVLALAVAMAGPIAALQVAKGGIVHAQKNQIIGSA
jgi:hypothetical protein